MIKKCLLLLFGIIYILGAVFILDFFNNYNSIEIPKNLHLKNGDLILRCGKSTESYAVILADSKTEFSHIGIISIENQVPFVIHAVPHKNHLIKKDKLNVFLSSKNASKYAVYRANFNEEAMQKVTIEAQLFYDKKCTFDTHFDLTTNTKLYCTELIFKAFKNAGIPLKIRPKEFNYIIGKQPIILPSEFTKAPIFNKII